MIVENVTARLNEELSQQPDIAHAFAMIASCPLLHRETRSAAVGELSEHLIARMVGGKRVDPGNKGYDVEDAEKRKIEIKSRSLSKYGASLKFDFGKHTEDADIVYCIAWDDTTATASIYGAYSMPVRDLCDAWGGNHLSQHSARTTLGKLEAASKTNRSPEREED